MKTTPRSLGLDLKGSKALVSGGSRGIGSAAAELLLALGAEVAICARGADDLEATRARLAAGGRCHAIAADLSTQEGVRTLIQKLPWQELDILVNNCGTNIRKKAEDYDQEDFEKVFGTNFMSCMWLSQAALPLLRRASAASRERRRGGAAVVNISSVAGRGHIPTGFPYAASKAAMDQMTRNLAVEWARFGIRVNAVAPGLIQTELVQGSSTLLEAFKQRKPLKRLGEVVDVARPIAFLASDAASFITGQTLYVDGGFTATNFNEVPGYWEDTSA
ncbi:unnamed protein product [Symbiodinium natans]|uniref:Gluconate 5-dehydrogenase n=1 Tax=Symbiodinium natans TaxID=878477 RepID=A0A812KZT2_9DINO|nr:unnamed protein product [Symbiodinium natans]